MEKLGLTVIVPMFNEEENVERTIAEISSVMQELNMPWELIVVDDGSIDKTPMLVEEAAKGNPNVKVVHHPRNLGVGRALRTGFEKARGEIIATIDADLSYSPKDIPKLLKELEGWDADIVLGSPYMEMGKALKVPLHRLLISRLGNMALHLILGLKLSTVTSIFRCYKRSAIEALDLRSDGKEIHLETVFKASALGLMVREVPVELRGRELGKSKFKARKAIATHLTFSLQERPTILFRLLGLAFSLLGFLAGLQLLYELYFEKVGIMRPLLILAVLLIIVGFQTFSFSFLADQILGLRSEVLRIRRDMKASGREKP